MGIKIQPSAASQWYELVKETQHQTGLFFDDHIESYLILTLDKFMLDKTLMDTPIAIDFLKSIQVTSSQSNHKLRKVGDRCLIISGLFPERASKINLSVSYYIDIGQQAYLTLAERSNIKFDPELFQNLGLKFLDIKEVLNAMRLVAANRILN